METLRRGQQEFFESSPVSHRSGDRMGGSLLAVLAALALFAGAATISPEPAHAADLFLTGEREIYLAVDKLNAMGRLPGFLANTRPYSTAAVRAAIDNAAAAHGVGFDGQLVRWIAYATKPTFLVRGTAGLEWDEKRETRVNEGGVPTPKGVSGRLSALAREETTPYVSAHASAAAFFGKGGENGTRVGETAIEAGVPSASLQIGKISTWYGPGRLGALIFTNNAQSYPGIRLHNPVPIASPGFFSFLGSIQYDLFLARLESDRPIANPLLFGMRLAAHPGRFLEIGISRSMIYGGEGHDTGLSAWWDAFKGENTNDPGSKGLVNQIAGFDVTLTLPFSFQPVQAYLEMAGEDGAHLHGTAIQAPSKFAYVTGLFLPTLFGSAAHDLRVEWARNHWRGNGPSWYVHSVSDEGYAHFYRNRVLGHPMGNDAQDITVQGHHFFLPSTYLEMTLSRTDRFSLGPLKERTDRASAGFVGWLSGNVRAEGEIVLEKVKNSAGLPSSPAEDASFRVALSYQFGRGR